MAELVQTTLTRIMPDDGDGNWSLGIRGRGDDVVIELFWRESANTNPSVFTVNRGTLVDLIKEAKG